jgi:RNA polymerase sigma-70 factor (ECF subfamily)
LLERERPYVQFAEEADEGEAIPLTRLVAGDDPHNDCTRNEAIKLVREAVLALPERYREVIVLCDFLELSCAEAALALDCPVGTVNSRLHRGHALLLKKLRAAARLDPATPDAQGLRCFA